MEPLIDSNTVNDICDFGCGDGWYLNYFGNRYPTKRYYGIDISSTMLERARKVAPFATLQASDEGITFNNSFDLVYSIAVFAHIEDNAIPALFANIHKCLKPGGRLSLFEQTGAERRSGETWCRRNTREYVDLLLQTGFIVVERKLISFPMHNLFDKRLAPLIRRIVASNISAPHQRCIVANQSLLFQMVSSIFLKMTCRPIKIDNGKHDGDTLYVCKKSE